MLKESHKLCDIEMADQRMMQAIARKSNCIERRWNMSAFSGNINYTNVRSTRKDLFRSARLASICFYFIVQLAIQNH